MSDDIVTTYDIASRLVAKGEKMRRVWVGGCDLYWEDIVGIYVHSSEVLELALIDNDVRRTMYMDRISFNRLSLSKAPEGHWELH